MTNMEDRMSGASGRGAPPKILIINDSPEFLDLMREILVSEGGYEVATLDQSEGVVHQISRNRPDLVILDIVFHQPPDGLIVAAMLADAEHTRGLPVLFCTALGERDIAEEAHREIHSRNQRILYKPFEIDTLLDVIADMLESPGESLTVRDAAG
ncbi:MAG TPA: response regulator [Thermomicrobiales bacterium]|jgi:DNA-binding NtrC family response regulator|nr:hypothetical protein [Chloroflexota bacterium]HQZ90437.1 response regulator [Thermomicrobiales bacterium]